MLSTCRQIILLPILTAAFASHTLQVVDAAVGGERPSRIPVFLNWDYNCLALPPEGIAQLAADAKQAGVDGLNIRICNKGALNFRTKAGTCYTERLDAFGPDYDPLQILVDQCRRKRIVSCAWFDLFEGAYARILQEHPEFCPQGLPGKPRLSGFPCYAHPEVREYMLAIVDKLAAYRPDHVFFCTTSSHIPANQHKESYNHDSGFNPPVVERYRQMYGVDILHAPFDRNQLGRIRGEFLLDFLVAAKQRLHRAGIKVIVGATLSGRLQPAGPNLVLDWRRILDRKAADVLLMANSRSEYWAFFNPAGQEKFCEIASACHKANVEFWPYFMADGGTYDKIAKEQGMDTLLDYLPRQMDYFHRLGGTAVLIHDLDLLVSDPGLRRRVWQAVGQRPNLPANEPQNCKMPIPQPRTATQPTAGGVPDGGFEASPLLCWYTTSSWRNEPKAEAAWGSFEHATKNAQPSGWQPDTGDNDRLFTVYDWRVLHNDPNSGRSYCGRDSILLGAKSGAGEREPRTAQWTADFPVPSMPLGRQILRVQTHGEGLQGIAKAGMHVEVFDRESHVLAKLDAAAPTKGTYAWQPIEIAHAFAPEAARMKVSLFLTVDKTAQTAGRLWFDSFEIVPAAKLADDPIVLRRGLGAFEGQGYAELAAVPGIDMVSAAFRVALPKGGKLRLALRSDPPMVVTVRWQGEPCHAATFHAKNAWTTYTVELRKTKSAQTVSIVIRPQAEGTVSVDAIELLPAQ